MNAGARTGALGVLPRLARVGVSLIVWAAGGFGLLTGSRVVTLYYHAVTPSQRARFERQMAMLRGRAASIGDVAGDRRGRLGRPAVVVTFDDAFASLLDNAIPPAAAHGVPLTIFAVMENLGMPPRWSIDPSHPDARERVMSEQELRTAAGAPGVRFGSHTCTHPRLGESPMAMIHRELRDSKSALEALLGAPVEDLALPHGSHRPEVIDAAQGLGYKRVFTIEPRWASAGAYEGKLGRFTMSPDAWPIEFRLTIDGAFRWLGLARTIKRRLGRRPGAALQGGTEASAAQP